MCEKDKDIENFLKEKAILFERLGKSRTFFIFDEENDGFKILAYFTLALQVLKVPEELLSGRKTKLFDGFSSKIRGDKITEFPTILIGQLGKNDLYKDIINGFEVMHYCLGTLLEGQARLGGRIIMLVCRDVPSYHPSRRRKVVVLAKTPSGQLARCSVEAIYTAPQHTF